MRWRVALLVSGVWFGCWTASCFRAGFEPLDLAMADATDAGTESSALDQLTDRTETDQAADRRLGDAGLCGNGTTDAGEACDDGNNVTETECPYGKATCKLCDATCSTELDLTGAACGDGSVDAPYESCDDGGTQLGDGCDAACQVEPNWHCNPGNPSLCAPDGWAAVQAGTFTMGSPTTEEGRDPDEVQHQVTLTHAFAIRSTETTQQQFDSVMGWNPSYHGPNEPGASCGMSCPVEYVSWFDMLAYANQLTIQKGHQPCYVLTDVVCRDGSNAGTSYISCMNTTKKGIKSATVTLNGVTSVYACKGYRLPTEAEWEYAARAGSTGATYNGELNGKTLCETPHATLDPIAWYCGNSNNTTHPVNGLKPNAWGLYDVLGGVWEWCWDHHAAIDPGNVTDPEGPITGTQRIFRGGSWYQKARYARSANRDYSAPDLFYFDVGGRLAKTMF